jgi:hypothetical protein
VVPPGLAGDTVVLYTSDQGFFLGDHGWYDKRFMYEESLAHAAAGPGRGAGPSADAGPQLGELAALGLCQPDGTSWPPSKTCVNGWRR